MVKGALVVYTSALGMSVPNVVLFQFNPTQLRHSWSPRLEGEATPESNPLAVAGSPRETFAFTLAMDVTDQMADPSPSVVSEVTDHGIYNRLAALEMLLFPTKPDDGLTAPTGDNSRSTPSANVPAVLFVWGKGRILPVRVTSLTITERIYDAQLNPTHAEAEIQLGVLTPNELATVSGPLADLMQGAYDYSQAQREARALAHLGDSARAVTGLLADLPLPG